MHFLIRAVPASFISVAMLAAGTLNGPGRERVGLFHFPLTFERNDGQAPANAWFIAHGAGYSLLLGDGAAVLNLQRHAGERASLQIGWAKGPAQAEPRGEHRLPGTTNYLTGSSPSAWHTSIPNYARPVGRW